MHKQNWRSSPVLGRASAESFGNSLQSREQEHQQLLEQLSTLMRRQWLGHRIDQRAQSRDLMLVLGCRPRDCPGPREEAVGRARDRP
jgi:hypothetical protein